MSSINGGDSAEQIVRIMFQGMDVALRLTGSATKNLAQLLIMASKSENTKVARGETTMMKLLKEGKPLQTYRMKIVDLPKFKAKAKKFGILFAAIKDARSDNDMCDLILRQDDIPRFNTVIESLGLSSVNQESVKKNNQSKTPSNSTKETLTSTKDKPSVKEKLKHFQSQLKKRTPKVRSKSKGR